MDPGHGVLPGRFWFLDEGHTHIRPYQDPHPQHRRLSPEFREVARKETFIGTPDK